MIITIEGNIGAGKTTFAALLYRIIKEHGHPVVLLEEPGDSWTNCNGVNLLNMMYSDRRRWAFAFQVNALVHMTRRDEETIKYVTEGYTVVRERSLFSVQNIFTPLLAEEMLLAEKVIAKELCDTIGEPFRSKPDIRRNEIIVYFRTDPDICHQRIIKRGRPEEIGRIGVSYLKRLDQLHDEHLFNLQESGNRVIVHNTGNDDESSLIEIISGTVQQETNKIISGTVQQETNKETGAS